MDSTLALMDAAGGMLDDDGSSPKITVKERVTMNIQLIVPGPRALLVHIDYTCDDETKKKTLELGRHLGIIA
jgi:hypothetical protein